MAKLIDIFAELDKKAQAANAAAAQAHDNLKTGYWYELRCFTCGTSQVVQEQPEGITEDERRANFHKFLPYDQGICQGRQDAYCKSCREYTMHKTIDWSTNI